ncbi:hypothetical protein [Terricaulis sp.]|uniref:hypothetical protein n=1 Tax=Terricaulis sp. TaxID=2768686 RepID=UPI003784FC68
MLLRGLVVVGLVGFISFAANIALADDVSATRSIAAFDGVSFADSQGPFGSGGRFDLSAGPSDGPRFTNLGGLTQTANDDDDGPQRYEVALLARESVRGLDAQISHRGTVGVDENGDISTQSRGTELRLGRGLGGERNNRPSATPTWYFFAASDDEALTWRPGGRNAFGGASGSFSLQDRVEVGDLQAGVTYEVYGIQASLAYVEREISVRTGSQSFSHDEDFAGVTLTMRH